MQIECPNCKLSGQVSDINIPPEGRSMECPRCKQSFIVTKRAPANWADTLTDCPRCGYAAHSGERFDICPSCGLTTKERSVQPGKAGADRKGSPGAGRPDSRSAVADSEMVRQDLERLLREEEKKRRLHATGEAAPMPDEQPVPESVVVPAPVRYLGWGVVAVGILLAVWGGKDFYDYRVLARAPAVATELAEPPGPVRLYLGRGLLPTLQVLLGVYAVAAGSQFLKMRPWSRKGVEAAAWGSIVYAAVCQLAKLIDWLRISSDGASFVYYFAGFGDALLMTAIWSLPLLAVIWYLRGDTIGDAFEE